MSGTSLVPRRREPAPAPRPSYARVALTAPVNVGLLAMAAGWAAAVGSLLPVILAVGAELVYLGTVPGLPRFRRLVDAREAQRRRLAGRALDDRVYAALSPRQRAHVDALRERRDRIREIYGRLGVLGDGALEPSLSRIDRLLSSFVRLLDQLNAYRRTLDQTDRPRLEREVGQLEAELATEASERLRDIKGRRRDILRRRLERFGRAEENREIISHQLAAIEDLLALVHEQALTLRDPQDVSRQLDVLAAEVEETEGTVREMAGFLALQEELGLDR